MASNTMRLVCILAAAMLFSACSAERSLEVLSTVSSSSHYMKTADIAYGSNPRQKMDFYQPVDSEGASADSGVTVVFVYGGAWRTGSRQGYEFIASALTKAGHRVLIPDYRLYPEVRYPQFVDDIAQAIATFESLPISQDEGAEQLAQAPIENLVLMGHSSGAHQVALLLTDPGHFEREGVESTVKGFIGISGPYDLPLELEEVSVVFAGVTDPEDVNPVMQAHVTGSQRLSGVDVLLLHGSDDERVLPFHTQRFAEALKDSGANVSVHMLDSGHAGAILGVSGPLWFLNDAQEYVLDFLDQEKAESAKPAQ